MVRIVTTVLEKVTLQSEARFLHCTVVWELAGMFFFGPMPPHVLCGLRGPPSWTWQECNRLLRLGRP